MSVQESHVADSTARWNAPESPEALDLLDRQSLDQRLRDSERHFQSWFEDAPSPATRWIAMESCCASIRPNATCSDLSAKR